MEVVPSSVGAKTARACDSCVRYRARWYCAADDAFLCQNCDASVHSANPLARRHQRIRLKTASALVGALDGNVVPSTNDAAPSWLKGFKRKARTPRASNNYKVSLNDGTMKAQSMVPDFIDTSPSDDGLRDEQLLYQVPDFDPVLTDFCSAPPISVITVGDAYNTKTSAETSAHSQTSSEASPSALDDHNALTAFTTSEMDLAEFTANMESLLSDAHDDAFCIEKLGLADPIEDASSGRFSVAKPNLKAEEGEDGDGSIELDIDVSKETLELGFDWESPEDEGDDCKLADGAMTSPDDASEEHESSRKKAKLRLDYEAVIEASSSQGLSPWTDGQRPQINLDGGWPDYMGMWVGGGIVVQGQQGEKCGDGEREARVSRYREKRRMRLFSKKIRYEVRKLNAEKRPRMKGRFVKRTTPGLTAFAHC